MEILRHKIWTAVGLFGLAAIVAAPAMADFVINDDLIVDGSACIGFDCVNGEVFGFDTIRIKENNLRIKAEDTSNTASFPTQDWQLTFNDSANGGANKFSVECVSPGSSTPFTVTGCAPSHSLFIASSGRVGFGTSSPVAELHVVDGDTPTLRLQQDGSSGFTPQTWDVAGNETNFFIRDVTNGSRLPLRIRPSASTSSIDIQADGSVEFGGEGDGGDADLHVKSANNKDAIIGLGVSPDFNDGNADAFIFGYNGNAQVGKGFIGTRPTADAGNAPIDFLIENVLEMTLSSTGLNVVDAISVGGMPLNVPDYVFGEDYELMPLDELASFVAANKHLPGVPPEAEIKSQGLDLGGFQMRLLEKVEELVRYTLDQQQTIDELTARLEAMESAD